MECPACKGKIQISPYKKITEALVCPKCGTILKIEWWLAFFIYFFMSSFVGFVIAVIFGIYIGEIYLLVELLIEAAALFVGYFLIFKRLIKIEIDKNI